MGRATAGGLHSRVLHVHPGFIAAYVGWGLGLLPGAPAMLTMARAAGTEDMRARRFGARALLPARA